MADDQLPSREDLVRLIRAFGLAMFCALAIFVLPGWIGPRLMPAWMPDTLATITLAFLLWPLVRRVLAKARSRR